MMPCLPDKMFRSLFASALVLILLVVLCGANSGCSLTKTQIATDGSSVKEEKLLKLRNDSKTSASTLQPSTMDAPAE